MQASMTAAEIMQLELQLAGRVSLLQFGCGNSTLVAARQAQKIVCVDGDAGRLAEVGANLARAAIDFTPFHADIGPTGAYGYPAGSRRLRDWPRYHVAVWRQLSGSPDAVLIDGRFRVACLLQAIVHGKPDCLLLFHGFTDRPDYRVVLKHTDMLARVDSLAVLRARQQVDGTAVLHDLFDHFLVAD
ncbi:hypothetical protein CVO77_06920 [Sphingopyxis lindanitolerans]|uniref:Class I SAM-dependent methyltransferase n=1 Tax=Sphingopyxis lindanitolerans TaxID=2054227 RepID=A0A2S8B746_9SPHN|nr:hypothetical protein [Sphingopyxis lindanitolerans]PQM28231.1 hypothetical protein CVO77_06920 [Sphingopyxis lindanitolerans]